MRHHRRAARSDKPDRVILKQALRRLGAVPGTVAHVAEDVTEIAPMKQFGCTTVWVRRNGRSACQLTKALDPKVLNLRCLLNNMGVGAGP